ncbi:4-alpha-glucanotransferase [Marinobacter nauticus]
MTARSSVEAVFARRRAGVLLHPTALPGDYGKLGHTARRFIDFLQQAGMSVWQTLPTGPTHQNRSPYQTLSAHAGNPEFIDLQELPATGLLKNEELTFATRTELLDRATTRFLTDEYTPDGCINRDHWEQFLALHQTWLDDFALFVVIRDCYPDTSWPDWPEPLRRREQGALVEFRHQHHDAIAQIKFEQFIFHCQWSNLRRYAHDHGVLLFGDIPIFVAHDSADVWANPQLFKLDEDGHPMVVAGVPPDYFSEDGQHWGNPLYDWNAMAHDHFKWWLERLASQREQFDLLRIDHFRGLQAFWEIPADHPQPVNGYWVRGPGDDFLKACLEELPDLPLVAENLGLISEDVEQLRHRFGLPGMTVLQFGFDGSPDNPHLLHNHRHEDLVYTGTHDNDTTLGWYLSLDDHTRHYLHRYLRIPYTEQKDMPWPIIQAALGSVSVLAILPMQDLLGLGSDARFNTPGTMENNWLWKLPEDAQNLADVARIRELLKLYGRCSNYDQ